MEHALQSLKTFRYFTCGDPSKATIILYVLHGYGQLAEYFIHKFQGLNENFFVVAPEGMHRFYVKGTSGRVGASWMTKEARESDIKDTMNWLDTLEEEIKKHYSFDKKIVLGFSQGGATAARWYTFGKNKPDSIIYWASVFPSDIEINLDFDKIVNDKNLFVLGNQDEYFTPEQQQNTLKYYSNRGFNTLLFDGNHSINQETLDLVLKNVQKKIYLDL